MRICCYAGLLFSCYPSAYGQDYCKFVTKEVSDDKKSFTYSSPYNALDETSVHVTRNVNIDPDYPLDNFIIIFRVTGPLESIYTKDANGQQDEKDEKDIVVHFDDNSTFTDTTHVTHDLTDDKLQAIRYVYYPLTDETVKTFTSKKIVKFSIAGQEQPLQADSAAALMHYVQCIKDAVK